MYLFLNHRYNKNLRPICCFLSFLLKKSNQYCSNFCIMWFFHFIKQYYDTKIPVIKYVHVNMQNNTKLYFNVCTDNSYEICAVLFTNPLLKTLLNIKQCREWDPRLHSRWQMKNHAFYAILRKFYFRGIHIIKLSLYYSIKITYTRTFVLRDIQLNIHLNIITKTKQRPNKAIRF